MKVKVTFIKLPNMSSTLEDLSHDRCPVLEVDVRPANADLAPAGSRLPAPDRSVSPLAADSLASLAIGRPATVVALGGQRSFRRRLLELGFVPGTRIVVRNVAPLGDPLEIEIRGCRVSIRRAEAQEITVQRTELEAGPRAAGEER